MSRPLRIVRLANFITPVSGGLRTALHHLGAGYLAAGHEPVLIVPGPAHRDEQTAQGRVITLPGPVVPGTGGYRVLESLHAVGLVRRIDVGDGIARYDVNHEKDERQNEPEGRHREEKSFEEIGCHLWRKLRVLP